MQRKVLTPNDFASLAAVKDRWLAFERHASFHGTHSSLTDLDDGNRKVTRDFRRVHATVIKEWIGCDDTPAVLKGALRNAERIRISHTPTIRRFLECSSRRSLTRPSCCI